MFAVAVQDARLYYSVFEGPQIWSVGLNSDGSFADDARLEIDVTGTPNGNVVTAIVFDGAGTLYLAQRGEIVGSYDYSVFAKPDSSAVLRYVWSETDRRWSEEAEEYAIGLKPPHRSTEGGIALNYGYDADGNIDYGQCRVTLWTTGEHLREGEESDRVYQGGARIFHGLQGNDKSKVRPANLPPFEAWFVDYDGLFVDGSVYGHVGDIAIFDPCNKRTVAEPTPLPFPPEPSFRAISPRSGAGPFRAGHLYRQGMLSRHFRHRNSLRDHGDQCRRDPVGRDRSVGRRHHSERSRRGRRRGDRHRHPRRARLDMFADADAGTVVASLPDALDPSETRGIEVVLDTGPPVRRRQFRVPQLCRTRSALVRHSLRRRRNRYHRHQDCAGCMRPRRGLHLHRDIANTGLLPFSGDVQLTDDMFLPDGTALGAPITAIVPPLACVPVPAAIGFTCVASLTLAPGKSEEIAITVTMPAAPPAYWAQNCFALSAPGLPPPALPLAPG